MQHSRSVIKNADRGYTCRDQDLDVIIMQTMNDSTIHDDRNEDKGYTLQGSQDLRLNTIQTTDSTQILATFL